MEVVFMKVKIIILIVVLILILLISCFFLFRKKVVISEVKSFRFSYSTGNMINAYVIYEFKCDNGKCVASIKPSGIPDEEKTKVKVDEKFVNKLTDILKKYDVASWNGFNKSNKYVLDGNSFSISIYMENGDDISASGYMMWPKHYREVVSEFDTLFSSITK